jgi:hypothetical protein
LNLTPSGKKSFKDFVAEKSPTNNNDRNVVSIYWLVEVAEQAGHDAGDHAGHAAEELAAVIDRAHARIGLAGDRPVGHLLGDAAIIRNRLKIEAIIDSMTPQERRLLLEEWNNTAVAVPPATLAALPDGTHLLGIRFRSAAGNWSVAAARRSLA